MKIKIVVLLIVFSLFSCTVFAQVQGNFGMTVVTPVRYVQLQALNADIHTIISDNHIPLPLPYAQLAYVFNFDVVDIGLGYKAWNFGIFGTLLFFPVAFADLTVAKIIHVEASMGGLLFTVLDLDKPTYLLPLPLLISEFGVHIKVFEAFQAGLSCLIPAYIADKLYLSCGLCVTLRFVLDDF